MRQDIRDIQIAVLETVNGIQRASFAPQIQAAAERERIGINLPADQQAAGFGWFLRKRGLGYRAA
jgi:hypothetical protein